MDQSLYRWINRFSDYLPYSGGTMDVSKPYDTIVLSVSGDVLRQLSLSTKPRTGSDLANDTGRARTRVQEVLDRLVEHGLVDREEAGGALLHKLNQDHILSEPLALIFDTRNRLVSALKELIDSWKIHPIHISLFGSAARGDGDTESDIDIFIVRPADTDYDDETWRNQLDSFADSVRRLTGNHAGIAEVGEDEISRLVTKSPSTVQDIRDDGIVLFGERPNEVLGNS